MTIDRANPALRFAPELIAVLLTAVAFGYAIRTTADLTWPPLFDFYREMGATQSILEGKPLADPAYLGEHRWYNPLVPRVVAWIAPITDLSLPTFYTRAGPYFNLIVPLAFFVFVRVLFGRWAAVASLAIFLFVVSPLLPPRVLGTYSPWLWTRNVTQGLFYFAATAIFLAFGAARLRWAFIAGVLLGLTFLAHTAPAIILVIFAVLLSGADLLGLGSTGGAGRQRTVTTLVVIGATSMVVSAPFLVRLLTDYGVNMKNMAPSTHVALFAREIVVGLLSLRAGMALVGGVVLVFLARSLGIKPRGRNALLMVLAATLLPLAYGILAQRAAYRGIEIRQLLPAFHFHLYFTGLQAIFGGIALYAIASWIAARIARLERRAPDGEHGIHQPVPAEQSVLVALLVVLIAVSFPAYLASPDLLAYRQDAQDAARRSEVTELYGWVLKSTRDDDVFLADELLGFYAVSSAARKVVVLPATYSNPYVDYDARKRDAELMYEYLRSGNVDSFLPLAAAYDVDYVVAQGGTPCCAFEGSANGPLRAAFTIGDVTVYEVGE